MQVPNFTAGLSGDCLEPCFGPESRKSLGPMRAVREVDFDPFSFFGDGCLENAPVRGLEPESRGPGGNSADFPAQGGKPRPKLAG